VGGVGGTYPVLRVEVAGDPGRVGNSLPCKLSTKVKESPPRVLREVCLRSVLETIEIFNLERSGQMDQAGVDILCVFISVNQEGCSSEITALYSDRSSTGGKGQLLHHVKVHVEDPEFLFLLRRHEDEVGGGDVQGAHSGVPGVDIIK